MKPEAQIIAIAEACGFRNVHWYEDTAGPAMLVGDPPPTRPHRLGRPDRHIPDYLTDLNAMQSAVMEKRDVLGGYCMELRRIVRRDTPEEYDVYGDINYYHATAAQRAKAFLRTLNLWTDDDCRAQESE